MDAFSQLNRMQGFATGSMTGAGTYYPGAAVNRLQGFNPVSQGNALMDPMMQQMNSQLALMEVMLMMLTQLMLSGQGTGGNPLGAALSGNNSSNGNSLGGGGGSGGGGGGSSAAGGASNGNSSSDSGNIPTGPVAPGVGELLKHAGSMVGLNENRDTKEIQKVTGESGINPANTPWCAAFAINLLKDHGVLDTKGLSNPNYCPTIKSWAQGKQIFGDRGKYQPKPGDAILFDWEGDGKDDHIGIVEKVENGKVYTIEGNSSDSVKRNVYDLSSGKIDGYVVSGKK